MSADSRVRVMHRGTESKGFGLIVEAAPDEFVAAGLSSRWTFSPAEGGHAVNRISRRSRDS